MNWVEECKDDHPDWNDEQNGEDETEGFHEETANDSGVGMETRLEPSGVRSKS